MMRLLKQLRKDQHGGVGVEYALIVAVIALGLIVGFSAFRTSLNSSYTSLAGQVSAQVPGP